MGEVKKRSILQKVRATEPLYIRTKNELPQLDLFALPGENDAVAASHVSDGLQAKAFCLRLFQTGSWFRLRHLCRVRCGCLQLAQRAPLPDNGTLRSWVDLNCGRTNSAYFSPQ